MADFLLSTMYNLHTKRSLCRMDVDALFSLHILRDHYNQSDTGKNTSDPKLINRGLGQIRPLNSRCPLCTCLLWRRCTVSSCSSAHTWRRRGPRISLTVGLLDDTWLCCTASLASDFSAHITQVTLSLSPIITSITHNNCISKCIRMSQVSKVTGSIDRPNISRLNQINI